MAGTREKFDRMADKVGRSAPHRGAREDSDGKKREGELASSSFLDLKAQLEEQRRQRPSSSAASTVAVTSLDVPRSHHSSSRKRRKESKTGGSAKWTTSSWSDTPSARLERDRQKALARKAVLYHHLQRGLSGGLRLEDLKGDGKYAGMIDWDAKVEERRVDSENGSGSDSELEMLDAKDEIVEYQDDFGRTRQVPRSQVPMKYVMQLQQQQSKQKQHESDDANVVWGPQAYFPLLINQERSQERRRELEEQQEADRHFDGTHEVRNRGAGFFKFASDADARARQLEQLKEERRQTEQARAQSKADQKGTKELGMGPETDAAEGAASLAAERLEARRRFVAEQTRKLAANRTKTTSNELNGG